MPISRTRKDYVLSGIVLFLIAATSVLAVYFTNPLMLRANATTKIVGITFPNFQGIVMRQPRMTVVIAICLVMFFTAFQFIARPALSFFSRPIAWISVAISGVGMIAIAFLTSAGTDSAWYRFFMLCLVVTAGSTIMAELMIFYRRLTNNWSGRTNIFHRLGFAIVCAILAGGIAFAYYHIAIDNGVFLDYGVKSTQNIQTPTTPDTTPTTPASGALTIPSSTP